MVPNKVTPIFLTFKISALHRLQHLQTSIITKLQSRRYETFLKRIPKIQQRQSHVYVFNWGTLSTVTIFTKQTVTYIGQSVWNYLAYIQSV